ncbi:NfeD family protein [Caviibacter abscessus]|uniref:NfeD family protein n=1 Tax=Caviibacter abscessus TaxID=1766719 RepID=UPI00083863B8|nr:NfeD family protein [Caviibacter abscessus]
MNALFWGLAAGIFLIIEVIIPGLISIWMALASFILLFISFILKDTNIQILIFLILTCIFIFITRPLVMKKIKSSVEENINIKIIAVVNTETEIKEYNIRYKGTIWTAISNDVFEVGDIIKIKSFTGNKVNIERISE